jgi:hypothetical protein
MKTHKACAQQVKTAVIPHEAELDNGPFGHTQQQATKNDNGSLTNRTIFTNVPSFFVALNLFFLLKSSSQTPWVNNVDDQPEVSLLFTVATGTYQA